MQQALLQAETALKQGEIPIGAVITDPENNNIISLSLIHI